ncbi:hypothetical protein PsorP6_017602 [Peronosclerospora sorghi]|uniref:Uncharacterized protein n=1 Tax=Peronosclerospora sorghi TaxID=230839 RepID=A0ACC0WKR7_9STRA|nr:hypothetical protein PsorP6_017602 [Peronosclerospora sorghi]
MSINAELCERDYYALLGVSRDATKDEIRHRFLLLSREFHPDRQARHDGNAALVAAANAQYAVLNRAYKVLYDPIKRHLYDRYGEKGVRAFEQVGGTRPSSVGPHLRASDEIQELVHKILRRQNDQLLEAQFSSFSEMSMSVDASKMVFAPMHGLRELVEAGARCLDRTETTLHQRTSFPLARESTLTLGAYLYDKRGLSTGSVTLQLAHASLDPNVPSFTLSSELGSAPKLHCLVSQPVSPSTVFMLIPELDDQGLDISIGANQVLTPQLHGTMMWSTRNGLSSSLRQSTDTFTATTSVAVNRGGPTFTCQFHRALVAAHTLAKVSFRANLATGLSFVAGATRELSSRTRLGFNLLLARSGVTLRLGFTRGNVRFVLPIFLSPFSPQSAFSTFCGATSPIVIAAVVSQLVRPAQERKRRLAWIQLQEAVVQYLTVARKNALEQQKLMLRCANQKRAVEQQREDGKGLVILLARYGKNPTNPDPVATRENQEVDDQDAPAGRTNQEAQTDVQWIDVSVPLQFFVTDGQLVLSSTSKAGLLGFYNPCVSADQTLADARWTVHSAVKPLLYDETLHKSNACVQFLTKVVVCVLYSCSYVRYAYDGQVFEATFDDDQVVNLPSRYAQAMGPAGRVY